MRPRETARIAHQPSVRNLLFLVLVLALLPIVSVADPLYLDPTFGDGGKLTSSPTGTNTDVGGGIALLPDGKILAVGGTFFGPEVGFLVARYTSAGSLDVDWGNNGWVSVTFPGVYSVARSVALQPDGKIVVVGDLSAAGGINAIGVVRLGSDGSLDTTFDTDGRATVSFGEFVIPGGCVFWDSSAVVRIADDGKIVVGGTTTCFPSDSRFVIGRFNSNGSLDTGFAAGGRMIHTHIGLIDRLNDLIVLSDRSIVAVGQSDSSVNSYRIAIKYNETGAVAWSSVLQGGGELNGVAVQADGKLVATGARAGKIAAVRFNANGTVDGTFNTPATTPLGQASSVAIQADGKIVANVAYSEVNSNGWFSAARFNSDGSLDTTFGGDGFVDTRVAPTGDSYAADAGYKLIIQPDGKILIGGHVRLSEPEFRFAMVRYRANAVPDNTDFDYDGDGRADISVFRPSNGVWYLDRSTAGFTAVAFGASTDRIVPADYDGDGKSDIAIYREGEWWILQSSDGVVRAHPFGSGEDKPQPGDFDGDGKADIAVWRPSNRVWYVLRSGDWGYHSVEFGATGDIPQRGDFDDDGKTDFALFRPSDGHWYIQRSTGGYATIPWGTNGDVPVASDFDGDNKPDVAVFRPSNGVWYILKSGDGQVIDKFFGMAGDVPIPADYDGDGKSDIAVFRPSDGTWYRINSSSGQWAQQAFGFGSDKPTPGAFGN